MAVLRSTLAPSQHHSLVGQEHGLTIPLAVIYVGAKSPACISSKMSTQLFGAPMNLHVRFSNPPLGCALMGWDVRICDDGSRSQPIDPDDFRRAVSSAAAGCARPDHCIDRAANDRRRARRPNAPFLGGHVLSALQHCRHAAIREIRRSLRAQDRAARGDCRVPGGLSSMWAGGEHAAAHPVPRFAGDRRGRAHCNYAGGDRRSHSAPRARPLSGAVRRRVCACQSLARCSVDFLSTI